MEKERFISIASEQGPRKYQEDRYFSKYIKGTHCRDLLLAVMDGHRGSTVAEICNKAIGNLFNLKEDETTRGALFRLVSGLNKMTAHLHEGSTLSVAFIEENTHKVTIAVLGDSPVIVLDNNGQLHISPEHNVRSNPKERMAAEKRGGIYEHGYIFAKDGNKGLQLSRALGDAYLGDVISHEPEIYTIADPQWILVASDGIIDPAHGESDKLIEEIAELAKKNAIASDIMQWAKSRGLGDNATAIVWG